MIEIYVQNIIFSINQITQDACTVLFLGKSFDNGLKKCFIVRKVPIYGHTILFGGRLSKL